MHAGNYLISRAVNKAHWSMILQLPFHKSAMSERFANKTRLNRNDLLNAAYLEYAADHRINPWVCQQAPSVFNVAAGAIKTNLSMYS